MKAEGKRERRNDGRGGWEDEGRKTDSVPWFGLETLITQDHRL